MAVLPGYGLADPNIAPPHPTGRSLPPASHRTDDIAVVLLNWHDETRTIAAVRAARELDVYGQIIVLDNESTDTSRGRLERECGDSVTLVPIAENRGFGAAHNVALEVLRPEIAFVLVLNTDAATDRASVQQLRARFDRDQRTAAVGPVIYDFPAFTGTEVQSAGGDERPDRGVVRWRHAYRDVDPACLTFGACMLRRSALPAAPFDERQFMYWEDVDLCRRLVAAGHRLVVVPEARAWHEVSASGNNPASSSLRLATYFYWSGRVFARKRRGLIRPALHLRGYGSWLFRIVTGDHDRAAAVLDGLRLPIPDEPAWAVREQLLEQRAQRRALRVRRRGAEQVEPAEQFSAMLAEIGSGSRSWPYLLTHPIQTLSGARALPAQRVQLRQGAEGLIIAKWLAHSFPLRTPLHAVTAVLEVPERIEQYTEGSGRQTLRRKVREAVRLGVTWRTVTDSEERRRLLRLAEARERAQRTSTAPLPDHGELLHASLWLLGERAGGEPLLLAVVPVDGEWALLRYFWTLADGRDASAARYLMTQVLVEQLIARGARHLVDPVSPLKLSSGLRQFQRMTGFTMHRLHAPRPTTRQLAGMGLTWEK